MSRESRMTGGILLVILPTVMYSGISLLNFLGNLDWCGRIEGVFEVEEVAPPSPSAMAGWARWV